MDHSPHTKRNQPSMPFTSKRSKSKRKTDALPSTLTTSFNSSEIFGLLSAAQQILTSDKLLGPNYTNPTPGSLISCAEQYLSYLFRQHQVSSRCRPSSFLTCSLICYSHSFSWGNLCWQPVHRILSNFSN